MLNKTIHDENDTSDENSVINSAINQELWGVYIDFKSYHSNWTIGAVLQHMGFYTTTENPCVMMRENNET